MFSGQGSQFFQMGAPLYRQDAGFRQRMDRMDALLRPSLGQSVVSTLYEGTSKADMFDDLVMTSASIFALEIALAETLMDAGVMPDITLGASLGSYAASVVSGCIGLKSAAQLVVSQARIFRQEVEEGGMIAVLEDWRWAAEDPFLQARSVIAGIHCAQHVVLSARQPHLPEVEAYLRAQGRAFQRLPLRHPFHSPWIDAAKPRLLSACDALVPAQRALLPMACCAAARCLTILPPDHFWNVAREPIRFDLTIMELERQGPSRYVDVGPSSSLATFLKYLLPQASMSRTYPIVNAFGQDVVNLAAVRKDLCR